MATVYNVEIKMVSAWVNYNEQQIKEIFEKFLSEQKGMYSMAGFEIEKIKVNRIA